MIIHNLNIMCIALSPTKANAPLVIDPDAMLSRSVAGQSFQSVPWWDPQRHQIGSGIKHPQFPQRCPLNLMGQFPHILPAKYLFSLRTFERPNHKSNITRRDNIVKR